MRASPPINKPFRQAASVKTAYHEAGHVVAAMANRIKFKYVTIVPDENENLLGHVHYSRRFVAHKNANSFTARAFIKHGIITLAGVCAEKIKFNSYDVDGFGDDSDGSDRSRAVDFFCHADVYDAMPYYKVTERLLTKHWLKVERVAAALQQKKTLDYKQVKDLIND